MAFFWSPFIYVDDHSNVVVAGDPFYPALPTSDQASDVMAAFGGGVSSNNGHQAQASPWDLGGLDPVPLMGQVSNGTCDGYEC